ncbi:PepSY domain-containing protein [Psychrobacter immobilis]|uniref:PepSY domain-containing protein n=1 Tax=Psychrobacter immobilis TaxID=498 RepID=UPI00191B1ED6|nr:PepSY domain-containing protein [Psychrobacter immobilis]
MSLSLLKPLLLTVSATSLVFFGGVIALSAQSPSADSVLSVVNPVTQPQFTQPSSLAALSAAQAIALAKQDVPNAILQAEPELINYNGTAAYEVLFDSGTTYIDANFGAILNPVATSNDYVESYDYDDDDDDDHKDKHHDDKHDKEKHHDKYDKKNSRLIATSYQQYDEDGFDGGSYDD